MLTITYCLFLSRAHDRNKGIKEKNTKVSKGKHAENYMNMHIVTILHSDAFKLDSISVHKKGASPCSG